MNWQEAIASINYDAPENKNSSGWTDADPSLFASALGLDYWNGWNESFDKRCRKYWIRSWICTDTRVGLALYKLDGVPVAVSSQTARKSDENLYFLSTQSAEIMREVILDLMKEDREDPRLVDLTEELGDGWFEGHRS